MAGSRRFARLAEQLIHDSDLGAREREKRWRVRQLMQHLDLAESSAPDKGGKLAAKDAQEKSDKNAAASVAQVDLACACGESCNFAVVLANLSRVLWMGYEEYELLHACYTELFSETQRPVPTRKVEAYWHTFVVNPKPPRSHSHPKQLLLRCQAERAAHLAAKAKLPVDPVAPLHRSLLSRLLDPFSFFKCSCMHCTNLDAIMDYRVALFSLLTEYCELFEEYACLFWCSGTTVSPTGLEVILSASELDLKMFHLMMSELYTATSFSGETTNVMGSLSFVRNLIYR